MKRYILIFISLGLLVSCGDSKFGASSDPQSPAEIDDLIDPFNDVDDAVGNIVSEHCGAVVPNQHSSRSDRNYFLGNGTIGSGASTYRNLLEIGGVCLQNGATESNTGSSYSLVQNFYYGTASCDYWDQNYELILGFDPSDSLRAKIFIKTTGDGYPAGFNGQGFPTEQLSYDGYIDCTKTDLTINALAWNQNTGSYGYITIIVPQEYGHKNHYSMRANLYFQGQKLGTSKLDIQ